jgi:integrase
MPSEHHNLNRAEWLEVLSGMVEAWRAEDSEDEEVHAMSREELATFLDLCPEQWLVFFWFLAATGLRISEAVALQWRHLQLDGSCPHVKVRRALVKGNMGPPKSRYGRREVPLDHALVLALRDCHKATEWPGAEDPVFPASNGACLDAENLRRRVLKPIRGRRACRGLGSTPSATPARRYCSQRAGTLSRCRGARPPLRGVHTRATYTCSMGTSVGR